jgi:hypothetical protein
MSDSDSEDEERVEYFYDIIDRSPDVDDILEKLRHSPMVRAWKIPLSCRLLIEAEIDSLLDPSVVDWNDFYLSYLESISKHRGTNSKNACERSHSQIDELESLSDCLMKDHPECIVGGSSSKKNEWQSCINVLIFEFQREINNHLHKGSADLPTRVRDILACPFVPTDNKHGETMYYIAGAVLNMIGKLESRSMKKYTPALKEIRENAVSTKTEARNDSLPMAKVESKERVGLCYINRPFYDLILKIESVFHTLLSEKNIALYGIQIVADIVVALSKENLGFGDFFSESHDDDVKLEVIRRIIFSYGRTRGKDFVRKMNAQVGAKHHETLRSALGTTAAIAEQKAKEGNNKYDECPRYKFLVKQRKSELIAMCKVRKLRYSGAKKKLVVLIIEYEGSIQPVARPAKLSVSTTFSVSTTSVPSVEITDEEDEYLQRIINEMENESMDEFADYFANL